MPSVTVEIGPRLHFGFANLSLAHERIYGAAGVALEAPTTRVRAAPADHPNCDREPFDEYTVRACELLGVSGASVTVEQALPRHVGLGSGTRAALATLAAVAHAHDEAPTVRTHAPALGRGGRSGVGVGTFETGGLVVDGGHPTDRFTADRPADGDWTVPPVVARHPVPDDWRFLLVVPDIEPGRAGSAEDQSVRDTVASADPEPADRVAGVVLRRLLPAVATGAHEPFGEAVRAIGRATGEWFADCQGGAYRPPIDELVASLEDDPAVSGAGQSSWGPAVYAVTHADRADRARRAGHRALEAAGVAGDVSLREADNTGVSVSQPP